MKFKNSVLEESYNEYWNKHIVVLDNTIRTISLGFSLFHNNDHVPGLIEKYYRGIQNILSKLGHQTSIFEDIEYVQNYKKDVINQSIEDLSLYACIFPEYASICEKYKETINSSLGDQEKVNHRTPNTPF
ncbi:hypothetical protein [Legionella longbeachae]|uniref:Bile acid beta-glucosidase n=1 Tax=Legionella longbeachae serogroup 1 (strain NSW150) TaxID=661367 RepID=D3HM77_LEGLN|nr:hypothetical protein [Legionella longbeachae]VEE03988.1 bile acid beta-glucosidase [Legionella oakridgensis]HBD7397229.1 hypothetical protein [Legionella pneumophila]ARB93154.1 hypothetical protein A6J40_13665 [Legionella longbeachae]ARM33782.1 hypothetical protein B0B39_09675 [Legionella longbeachae]EEZ97056.1 conserved hypothetical protein [Legionella longbeachae D-4968]